MVSEALIKDFEELLGKDNVFTSEADRQSYSANFNIAAAGSTSSRKRGRAPS